MNYYVLAGGQSRRMGLNKALLKINGYTMIETVISAIPAEKGSIKIITNSPSDYDFLDYAMIPDRFPRLGPISGVHAGLTDSSFLFNFFLACDLPFISTEVIVAILKEHSGQDIMGVRTPNGLEPLCTIYSKNCLSVIDKQIRKKSYSMQLLFNLVASEFVKIPNPTSLLNVNTKQDWQEFLSIKNK